MNGEVWLYLQPRETEIIMRPVSCSGHHAEFLLRLQQKVDVVRNELTISSTDVLLVKAAVRNWRLGCEAQYKALDAAIQRHV